jgi:hypothetical protein
MDACVFGCEERYQRARPCVGIRRFASSRSQLLRSFEWTEKSEPLWIERCVSIADVRQLVDSRNPTILVAHPPGVGRIFPIVAVGVRSMKGNLFKAGGPYG